MTQPNRVPPRRWLSRRNFLKCAAAGLAGATVAGIDAAWIEPRWLSVTRHELVSARVPAAWNGLRIALLSDFHFRPGHDDELLEKVVRTTRAERPDLIALPGDFLDHDPRVVEPLLDHLGKLDAKHGVFASMGNHDGWGGNRATLKAQFERRGIDFLINQHSVLTVRGEKLAVGGTDFVWNGAPDPVRTFAGLHKEIPAIALVHEPDYFDTLIAHRDVLLQVSGHTHGGQCRVPLAGYAPTKVKYGKRYIHGAFQRQKSHLFVSRGIGTTGLPVRFACRPELVMMTLRHLPQA